MGSKESTAVPYWLTTYFTGFIEVVVFATAVALDVSGVMIAMITWTLIKSQIHWRIFTDEKEIARGYIAILGGILSLFFAIITGYCAGSIAGTWHPINSN